MERATTTGANAAAAAAAAAGFGFGTSFVGLMGIGGIPIM